VSKSTSPSSASRSEPASKARSGRPLDPTAPGRLLRTLLYHLLQQSQCQSHPTSPVGPRPGRRVKDSSTNKAIHRLQCPKDPDQHRMAHPQWQLGADGAAAFAASTASTNSP
jgi:hypothetical protein